VGELHGELLDQRGPEEGIAGGGRCRRERELDMRRKKDDEEERARHGGWTINH
jgi:hypothetical protein